MIMTNTTRPATRKESPVLDMAELARQETVTLIFLIKQIQIKLQIQIQIQIRQARGGGSPGGSNNFSHNFHCLQIQNYANKCLLSE